MNEVSYCTMCRFVPDLEDIVEFGEMVQKAEMPPEAVTAAKYAIYMCTELGIQFSEFMDFFKKRMNCE